MRRVGALLLAVAMVLGAVWLRARIDDDPGGRGNGDDRAAKDGVVRLVCATELAAVCSPLRSEDVEVRVEAAGVTADDLAALESGSDAGFDLWLTDAAWPGIVADNRSFEGRDGRVLGKPSDVLARSPVVLMVVDPLPAPLAEACDGEPGWVCVGDAATQQLAVGITPPDRGGLSVLASAVAGRLDMTDYAAQDFEDTGFSGWFDRLTTSGIRSLGKQSPLERGVAAPGTFVAVATTEREVLTVRRSRARYQPIYPEPVVTSDIVLVPSTGARDDDATGDDALGDLGVTERLQDLLVAAGWRVEGRALPDGADPDVSLPGESNLPRPGVLQRLRELWG